MAPARSGSACGRNAGQACGLGGDILFLDGLTNRVERRTGEKLIRGFGEASGDCCHGGGLNQGLGAEEMAKLL